MARIVTVGWESGNANESGRSGVASTLVGITSAVSSPVADGNWALSVPANNQSSWSVALPALAVPSTYFVRLKFQINTIPSGGEHTIAYFSAVNTSLSVAVAASGVLKLYWAGVSIYTSAASTVSTDTWHTLEFSLTTGSSSGDDSAELKLNGTSLFSTSGQTYGTASPTAITVGPAWSGTMYIDSLKVNDSTGTSENSWPNAGKMILLSPVSDNSIGGWVKPGGGTTNLYTSIDNEPPVGVAHSTSAAQAENQIYNASTTTSYVANLQTYADAGIAAATDTVYLVWPFAWVAAAVSTGAKSGSLQMNANPAIAALSFGNYYTGAAAGTFPTGWKMVGSNYSYLPSVTLGTAPTLAMNITGGTASRTAITCMMGAYVEYVPDKVALAVLEISEYNRLVSNGFSVSETNQYQSFVPGGSLVDQTFSVPTDIIRSSTGTLTAVVGGGGVALTGSSSTVAVGTLAVSADNALTTQSSTGSTGTLTPVITQGAALTGSVITSSPGSVPSIRDKALTTQVATLSTGTETPTLSLALIGSVSTSGHGTLTAFVSQDAALTGAATTATPGTTTAVSNKGITTQVVAFAAGTGTPSATLALTGQAITSSTGSVNQTLDKDITSQLITSSEGSVLYSSSITLTGASSTSTTGSVTPPAPANVVLAGYGIGGSAIGVVPIGSGTFPPLGIEVALTGSAIASSQGSVATVRSTDLVGDFTTTNTGTVVFADAVALTGSSTTLSAGNIIDVPRTFSGSSASFSTGTVANVTTKALTGQVATPTPGSLSIALDRPLTGSAVTTSTGTLSATPTKALSGLAATTSTGTLTPFVLRDLTGSTATASTGVVTNAVVQSLTGQVATLSSTAGAIKAAPSVVPTGLAATGSAGSFATVITSRALTGSSTTVATGVVVPTPSRDLTTLAATSAIGSVGKTSTVALTGSVAVAATGTVFNSATQPLTGAAASASTDTLTAVSVGALTGQGAAVSTGSVVAGQPLLGQVVNGSTGTITLTRPLTGSEITITRGTVTPVTVTPTTVSISGTILTADEMDLVLGGRTIVLTLTNGTWAAA